MTLKNTYVRDGKYCFENIDVLLGKKQLHCCSVLIYLDNVYEVVFQTPLLAIHYNWTNHNFIKPQIKNKNICSFTQLSALMQTWNTNLCKISMQKVRREEENTFTFQSSLLVFDPFFTLLMHESWIKRIFRVVSSPSDSC